MPEWKDEILQRLAGLQLTPTREAEIVEELTQHLDDHYAESLAGGATPEEAYRAALVELNEGQLPARELRDSDMKHQPIVIETNRRSFMGDLRQDLRYGIRMLRKNPGFTAVAVLILSLGIGANTAIFSVVNAVLLRPLPYPESERMMRLRRGFPLWAPGTASATQFLFWREHNRTFESMAAVNAVGASVNLTGGDEPERIGGARVSADFFRVYGIPPAQGRGFSSEEDRPGGERVVVISDRLWKRRFGADPGLLGRDVELDGEPYMVIGIMPPDYRGGDIWMPLRSVAHNQDKVYPLVVIGRLKPGVTYEQARADMDGVARAFRLQHPALMDDGEGIRVDDYHQIEVTDVRTELLVLLGAVCFVLLIACANVASLLLARAAARQKEVAIRSALGAGRFRLIQQSLTESALLAVLGGALGLVVAQWGLKALLALGPRDLPRLSEVQMDGRALLFTLAVALSTGILFGLAPAFQLVKVDLNSVLNESGVRASAGIRRSRLRSSIVIAEIGLSSMLLVGAALLIQTFANLRGVNPGFDPRNVLTFQLSLPEAEYGGTAQASAFFDRALQRIEALPGVETAAVVTRLPLEYGLVLSFSIEGMQDGRYVGWNMVSPNYFRALSVPLRRGRYFTEGDSRSSATVALINEALARRYFPNKDPIGELLSVGKTEGPNFAEPARQIVGVVGDVRGPDLKRPAEPIVYIPDSQVPDGATRFINRLLPVSFVIRTRVDPLTLAASVKREVLAVNRQQPIFNVRSLERMMIDSISRQRFQMILVGTFAAVALLLAAIGIYGVMSYSVSQRTGEIGIRMALGAQPRDVLKLVIGHGLILTLTGLALGLAGALGLTRLMAGLLYGVSATDPATFATIALLLTSVALLASYIPARRAMKIDPLMALRNN